MRSGFSQGPEVEAWLKRNAGEERADPRQPGRRSFDIVLGGETRMMMQVREPISVATAQAEQFDQAKQRFIQPAREAQGPVNQVVRNGTVGKETEQNRARE